MALTRGFVRNAGTTPLDARLMDMSRVVVNDDGSPRVGVLGYPDSPIVATTGLSAPMRVAVGPAEFVASKGKADGVTIMTNDGTTNVDITAAPASNSRITVIWVRHQDSTTGDAASTPIFGTTDGAAAASPTKPAIPTGATELATLRVYAGTTTSNGGSNTLTQTHQMTAMRGGVVPFRTVTELQAWTNAVQGQLAWAASGELYLFADQTVGWVHAGGNPVESAISFGVFGGVTYSGGTPTPRVLEQGGRIYLEGGVVSASATFVAGVNYQIATIASGLAPSSIRRFAVSANITAVARLSIDPSGAVTIELNVGFTGTLNLNLDSVSWPDKRLA